MEDMPLNYLPGMAGTVAFAVTAVLAVSSKGIDIFGATVLGVITAIGGGTLRDIIIDVPVFWAADLTYIWVAIVASLVAFFALNLFLRKQIYKLMLYLDALGVALFAIQSTQKAWHYEFGIPLAPVILGVLTAIGGGLIRDVLAGRKTLLMSHEIYAIPVLFGCSVYAAVLNYVPQYMQLGAVVCGLMIFLFRAAAIRWELSMPDILVIHPRQ